MDNEVEPAVVARMMEVTEANYGVAQEYVGLKARLLGLAKLANYDQYASLFEEMPRRSYAEAKETVVEAFEGFSPRFAEIARKFFDGRWIDAEVRPGKRGGAFSAGCVPSVHPYILLNHTDKLRDVSTMAHELGHGVHQYLSRKQTYLNFGHPLTTAETASVFAEFLVFSHLMKREKDPRVRLGLLCSKIEDAFATIFRQNVLTRFEQAAHGARRDHQLATSEICDLWCEANGRLFGEAVEMAPSYRWGWSYIPHFIHVPFYCYAYVFGELLVLSLYRMHQEEGERFTPRYIELLEAGSSSAPDRLLGRLGVEIREADFWQKGLNVLAELVTQAKEVAETVMPRSRPEKGG